TVNAQAIDNFAQVRRGTKPVITRHRCHARRQISALFRPVARGQVLELNGQRVELLGEPVVLVRRESLLCHSSLGGGRLVFLRRRFRTAESRAGRRIAPRVSLANFSASSSEAPLLAIASRRRAIVLVASLSIR